MNIFTWLDENKDTKKGLLANQLMPIVICIVLFILFVLLTYIFITYLINPSKTEDIKIILRPLDITVGFFLYFVTAVDYALIVGRMQIPNPGAKARVVMNIFTCVGCFVGVSVVLFLWGYAKEISWLILALLIFAGSVMVKLGYEGREYFENRKGVVGFIGKVTAGILKILYYPTRPFTFWIPELGSPKVQKMSLTSLAKWSFFLPFIIGLDDLVGYMGAMTIYNVFGLLFGIYLADILIDILIFVSPKFTKKIVESALLSLLAAYAFIFLAYKSFSEAFHLLHEEHSQSTHAIGLAVYLFVLLIIAADVIIYYLSVKFKWQIK